jgi:hypothetical protein
MQRWRSIPDKYPGEIPARGAATTRARHINTEHGTGYVFAVLMQTIYLSEGIGQPYRPIDQPLSLRCDRLA